MGECEFASETDPAVLKVILKVKPGLGPGYDWVRMRSLRRRLAGSALRRECRVGTRRPQQTWEGVRMIPVGRPAPCRGGGDGLFGLAALSDNLEVLSEADWVNVPPGS
jgi:hypothetical protein